MSTINIRVDEALKTQSAEVLAKLGLTSSEYLRQALEYVVEQQKLPFRTTYITEDEEALLYEVRERLANPMPGVKVNLDNL